MTKIKFLKVQFTDTIQPWEIPAFRGAIIDKVGRAHHWFHNHLDDKQYLYRYPKIQYKCAGQHPMLLCLHEGVEEVHKLFENTNRSLSLHKRNLQMGIHRLDLHEFEMKLLDAPQCYHLYRWIALNEKNYDEYQQITRLADRITFLESKLVANIISFAKSIAWHIPQRFEVYINELSSPRWVKVKDTHMMSFDVSFETKVFLPDYLGLGRKVSLGYGVVKRIKSSNYNKTEQ
ncbi:CRISPR-associated endonuclease Cas6 [uncultured Microscilla sp.]|uniref:CRISPR-associated endonuclease Cas6 n=1 Tax=uncultured Microscilla sp. TaxID=432653 RepID=UPI002630017B|nr:CRISPR-associated endonuclease Cas6 [uncultured Microscilla sp.]